MTSEYNSPENKGSLKWFKHARKTWEQSPRKPLNITDSTLPTFPFVPSMETAVIHDEDDILRSILESEYRDDREFSAASESNPVLGQTSPQQIGAVIHISSMANSPVEIFSVVSTKKISEDFVSISKERIHKLSMSQISQEHFIPAFEKQNIKTITEVEDIPEKSTGSNLQFIEDVERRTLRSKSDFPSVSSDEIQSEAASNLDSVDTFRLLPVEALTKFKPDMLECVDALLIKDKDKKTFLIQSQTDKYSDPLNLSDHEIGSNPFRQKPCHVQKKHIPDQLKNTNVFLEKFKGNEEAFIEKAVTKNGIAYKSASERRSDEATTNLHPVQIADTLTKHDPSNLEDASYLLGECSSTKDEHLKRIECKNGKTEKVVQESLDDGMNGTKHYREMLVAFYEDYNPAKLDTVNTTLLSYQGREELLFKKLHEKYVTGKDGILPAIGEGPTCFIDFQLPGSVEPQRVTIKLFADKVPLACDNFRMLCTGEMGIGRSGKPLCFLSSRLHRIIPNFCVQGGDFTNSDGTGGESIYPPNSQYGDMWGKFKDETFMMHSRKGLLSMANNGAHRNGSQFFFTLRAVPHLDGKHVVFGECVSGFEVIEQIGNIPTNDRQKPIEEVLIVDCGVVNGDGLLVRASEQLKTTGNSLDCNLCQPRSDVITSSAIITSVFAGASTCLQGSPTSLVDTIEAIDCTHVEIQGTESRKHLLSKDDVISGSDDYKSTTQETSEIVLNTCAGDEQSKDMKINLITEEQHILDPNGVSIRTVEPILMAMTDDEPSLGQRYNGAHSDFVSGSSSIAQLDTSSKFYPSLPLSNFDHVGNLDEPQTTVDASCHHVTKWTKDDQTVSDASTTRADNLATWSDDEISNSTAAKNVDIVFDRFDNQGNGKLPISVLRELLNALDENLNDIKLAAAINDIRSDDGDFDRESFMMWYHGYGLENEVNSMDDDKQGEAATKISDIFNSFSADGGLSVTTADFGNLVGELGISCNAVELFATVEEIKDSDGSINRVSFLKWYFSSHFGGEDVNTVTNDGDTQRVSHSQIEVSSAIIFGGSESESQEALFETSVDAYPYPFGPRGGAARTSSLTKNGGSANDCDAESK